MTIIDDLQHAGYISKSSPVNAAEAKDMLRYNYYVAREPVWVEKGTFS